MTQEVINLKPHYERLDDEGTVRQEITKHTKKDDT